MMPFCVGDDYKHRHDTTVGQSLSRSLNPTALKKSKTKSYS